MSLNMTIRGLAVKNITDKMNSIILTVSVFFLKNQEHKLLRFSFSDFFFKKVNYHYLLVKLYQKELEISSCSDLLKLSPFSDILAQNISRN